MSAVEGRRFNFNAALPRGSSEKPHFFFIFFFVFSFFLFECLVNRFHFCSVAPRRPRYCSKRLFRHARALPPFSGRNEHFCSPSDVQGVSAPPAPRDADTAPSVSSVTLMRCPRPRAASTTPFFAALPTYRPSLPRCPASPPILLQTSLSSRATARRAFLQPFPRSSRRCPLFPASPPMLLQPSPPSRASVSPTQRVQPPCSQPFQRTGRLCPTPVLPQTFTPSRGNAAPAPRAKPPCSQSFCRNTCKQAT